MTSSFDDNNTPTNEQPSGSDDVRDAVAGFFGADMLNLLDDSDGSSQTDESRSGSLENLVASIDSEHTGSATAVLEQPATSVRAAAGQQRCIVFTLNGTRYAVAMENVLEVDTVPSITPIPNVPDWVEGVTNLRGEIISVVDLRRFLSLETADLDRSQRLLVIKSHASEVTTSLIVDRVIGLRSFPSNAVTNTSAPVETNVARFLSGVVEHEEGLLAVLNVERLLQSDEMRQFEAVLS